MTATKAPPQEFVWRAEAFLQNMVADNAENIRALAANFKSIRAQERERIEAIVRQYAGKIEFDREIGPIGYASQEDEISDAVVGAILRDIAMPDKEHDHG